MISAVILAHNDQDVIKRAIASVAWTDETIVIDDASTDATQAVAKKAGAVVYQHSLNEDFAAQRNYALTKAKGEWVLFLDSDEVISRALADEITKQLQTAKARGIAGFYFKRHDILWGKELHHGETRSVRLLRMARRGAGKWVRPVHEVWMIQGKTETLNRAIHHFPHPNVAQFLEDIDRYSTLNAKLLHKEGIRSALWQIFLYPSAKFFLNFFVRRGFADGVPGAIVVFMMSFHSFLTRAKLYLMK